MSEEESKIYVVTPLHFSEIFNESSGKVELINGDVVFSSDSEDVDYEVKEAWEIGRRGCYIMDSGVSYGDFSGPMSWLGSTFYVRYKQHIRFESFNNIQAEIEGFIPREFELNQR